MNEFERWAFLYCAEREFVALLQSIGHPDPSTRAFTMVGELKQGMDYYQNLWDRG
jgi:hypothetical protein